jgi:hypothetical protein
MEPLVINKTLTATGRSSQSLSHVYLKDVQDTNILLLTDVEHSEFMRWRDTVVPAVRRQYDILWKAVADIADLYPSKRERLAELIERLEEINSRLWQLEDTSEKLYGRGHWQVEVSHAWMVCSVTIKRLNKLRSTCKQAIDDLLDSSISETKFYRN